MKHLKRFPSIADMERHAAKKMPGFVHDYLVGGVGAEHCVDRNRTDLDNILLVPKYLSDAPAPDMSCEMLGKKYAAPFGIAPLGLAGLLWPGTEKILSTAARAHNIPYILSTYATTDMDSTYRHAGDLGWFQFYPPNDKKIEEDMLRRAKETGFDTLVVTIDTPVATKRERDIKNGISIPPAFDLKTLWQMATHPDWSLRMAFSGIPQFEVLKPYFPKMGGIAASGTFIQEKMQGHITKERLARIRTLWDGKLLIKGVLDVNEAADCLALGADGIVLSNHGGRQFDAAPSAISLLPEMRKKLGKDALIICDGGIRSGLDIVKMIASGANFVLLGRPCIFAVAALDKEGGDHLIKLLKDELHIALSLLGCMELSDCEVRNKSMVT